MTQRDPLLPEEPVWDRNRLLSAALAVAYVIAAAASGEGRIVPQLIIFLVFPLVCIWYPLVGEILSGGGGFIGRGISQRTPAGCMRPVGWGILLLPILIWGITALVPG